MKFGWLEVLQVLGSVGVFIYGMKLMSDSVQRAAGAEFRKTIKYIAQNKWLGLGIGAGITAFIQSSSATTVMTVSFVNAGLFSAYESVGLILGANIGTTITGWIVSLLGFKVNLADYAVPIFAVAVPLMFISKGKTRYWGEFLVGLATIFLGLSFLRSSVPAFSEDMLLFDWLKSFTNNGLFSRLFFVLIGIVITVIVQSSSVAMAVTLTMCAQGWLPVEIAASLILGENIGTTSTAIFASVIANREAKIAARIHFYFNLLGVTVMVVILPYFLPLLSSFLTFLLDTEDIYKDPLDMTIGLSAFHTAFNVINGLILIHFPGLLTRLASFKLEGKDDDVQISKFISNVDLMPEMTSIQVHSEIRKLGLLIENMCTYFSSIINITDEKKQEKLIKKIQQSEDITDQFNNDITQHIAEMSGFQLTPKTSMIFKSSLQMCNELELIGDIFRRTSTALRKKMDDKVFFLPEQRENINSFALLIHESIKIMNLQLQSLDYKNENKFAAQRLKKESKKVALELKEKHVSRLGNADYNLKSAMIYIQVIQNLELVCEHIYNVTDIISAIDQKS
jgi:phosphate:Na+ symporter